MRIGIVTCAFNCTEFLKRCISSVLQQERPPDEWILVDDASTDLAQPELMKRVCTRPGWQAILNQENLCCPYNLVQAIRASRLGPQDVIFLLDGDDFLPHGRVLSRVAEIFSNPKVLLSYGSFTRWPDPNFMPNRAMPYPPEILRNRTFRTYRYHCYNHPLMFRRILWDQIPKPALQDNSGRWFRTAYDTAIMIPMLEMAGDRMQFNEEILYVYNEGNPISDQKVHKLETQEAHRMIRSRPILDRQIFP